MPKPKNWVLESNFQGQGVHINIDKRYIRFNKKAYMLRLETSEMIHIYSLVNEHPHGAQLKFPAPEKSQEAPKQ